MWKYKLKSECLDAQKIHSQKTLTQKQSMLEHVIRHGKGYQMASPVAQWWRIHLPMQETRVQSLGWEDPLEEDMAPHSSILLGKFHGQRSLVGCSP